MPKKTLTIEPREEFKKSAAKRLRREGKIPAVMYGQKTLKHVAVDAHEFMVKFHTVSENTLIELQIGKEKYDVLVKDYQEDVLRGEIVHIDFYEVEKGKLLRTHVPVHIEGTAIGQKEGGLLEHLLHEVEVECIPSDLPEAINIDVVPLGIGDSVHISDVEPPKGVKIMNADDQVIVQVASPYSMSTIEEEEEAEEGEEAEEIAEGEAAEGEAAEEE